MVLILFVLLFISCSTFNDKDSVSGYRTEKIGGQHWMAENLNVNVSGSRCYNDDPANCNKYGRLYDWSTAMALPDSCNYKDCHSKVLAKHKGICPSGWHIPSDAEWRELVDSIGGSSVAGRYLKATSGWLNCGKGDSYKYKYKCEDKFGFSALPGGIGYPVETFSFAGEYGYWWSASEYRDEDAYYRYISYMSDAARWYQDGSKSHFLSVRCVQN